MYVIIGNIHTHEYKANIVKSSDSRTLGLPLRATKTKKKERNKEIENIVHRNYIKTNQANKTTYGQGHYHHREESLGQDLTHQSEHLDKDHGARPNLCRQVGDSWQKLSL